MIAIAQIFGWIATILFSIMLVPQIVKTIRTRDTKGVSILFYIIYFVANIIALNYAFMIGQTPLKIKYSLALITTVFYITIFVYYKRKYNYV